MPAPVFRGSLAPRALWLSLEGGLPIAKAVAEANVMMGIEPQGPLAKQVETLLTELGVIS